MTTIVKKYVGSTVLDEARRRIERIIETHDVVVCAFSGGKDSQVAMHLTHVVGREMGIDRVKVQYRDEELVPRPVLDHVAWVREQPWVDLMYLACEWEATAYMLGMVKSYHQWDPRREWLRQPPAHAVRLEGVYDELFGFDVMTAELFGRGRVALITGVRAEESMNRYRSVVNRIVDNYISPSRYTKRVSLCKPLFDWKTNDIFKYLYENQLPYAKLYNHQMWAGDNLRVTSPLHATPAKQLFKLREIDPLLYEQVMSLFPEATVQELYSRELSLDRVIEKYGGSWGDIRSWLLANLDQTQLRWALAEFDSVYARWQNTPDSYPLKYLFSQFVKGKYMYPIQPLSPGQRKQWLS